MFFVIAALPNLRLAAVNSLPNAERSSLRSNRRFGYFTMNSSVLEIEEKFSLNNQNLESFKSHLSSLGFKPEKTVSMTDWYFDLPSYQLVRQDCWLRYRSLRNQGQWQLKIGQPDSHGSSTVYEEVEGADALKMVCEMVATGSSEQLKPLENDAKISYDKVWTVPEFPEDIGMVPFARIFTERESWKCPVQDGELALSIDLDSTDFGYAVGEVETVVEKDSEIPAARQAIRELIDKIKTNQESDDAVATGKLEYYLQMNRPALYDLCLKSGVLQQK